MAPAKEHPHIQQARDILLAETFCAVTTTGVATFGRINTEGKDHIDRDRACHAQINYWNGQGNGSPSVVYNWYYTREGMKRISKAWLSYLLGEVSPWRSIIEQNQVYDLEFAYKHGLVIYDLTVPANLLVNLFIAMRTPYEYQTQAKLWYELVNKEHIHPSVAYYFVGMTTEEPRGAAAREDDPNKRTFSLFKGIADGHWAINPYVLSEKAFTNFCYGTPGNPTKPFKDSSNYIPCTGVWEASELFAKGPPQYGRYLEDKYKINRTVKGKFGDYFIGKFKYPKLVSMMKAEQKRIGL